MDGLLKICRYIVRATGILGKLYDQLENLNQQHERILFLLQNNLQKKTMDDQLLNTTEAADLLGISERSIWNWKSKGKIKPIDGSDNYFLKSELLKLKRKD